jgi:hypothetical protein
LGIIDENGNINDSVIIELLNLNYRW